MEPKQPTSQKRSGIETPKPEELAGSVPEESEVSATAELEDAIVEDQKAVPPDALSVIILEELRALRNGKSKSRFSRIQTFSNNALVVVFFSGLVGGALTYYYTQRQKNLDYARSVQQQELGRRQSFSDEVNKLRIQKFGEVWEQLDEHEFAIDRLLDDRWFEIEADKDSKSNNKIVDDIRKLIDEDKALTSKNRFWLGEDLYNKTMEYLDMNVQYALNKLVVRRGTNLSEFLKKREDAKQDILEIRRLFLEGESGSQLTSLSK
jgi:hypothetical protein